MEKGLAQLRGVHRPGSRGRVLTMALQGRLAGLAVDLAVVDHLQPGQERLVELGQGGDGRVGQFGQEIGLDELEKALDLAPALGVIRCTEDSFAIPRVAQMVSSCLEE